MRRRNSETESFLRLEQMTNQRARSVSFNMALNNFAEPTRAALSSLSGNDLEARQTQQKWLQKEETREGILVGHMCAQTSEGDSTPPVRPHIPAPITQPARRNNKSGDDESCQIVTSTLVLPPTCLLNLTEKQRNALPEGWPPHLPLPAELASPEDEEAAEEPAEAEEPTAREPEVVAPLVSETTLILPMERTAPPPPPDWPAGVPLPSPRTSALASLSVGTPRSTSDLVAEAVTPVASTQLVAAADAGSGAGAGGASCELLAATSSDLPSVVKHKLTPPTVARVEEPGGGAIGTPRTGAFGTPRSQAMRSAYSRALEVLQIDEAPREERAALCAPSSGAAAEGSGAAAEDAAAEGSLPAHSPGTALLVDLLDNAARDAAAQARRRTRLPVSGAEAAAGGGSTRLSVADSIAQQAARRAAQAKHELAVVEVARDERRDHERLAMQQQLAELQLVVCRLHEQQQHLLATARERQLPDDGVQACACVIS